jgi:hypothetical protein
VLQSLHCHYACDIIREIISFKTRISEKQKWTSRQK